MEVLSEIQFRTLARGEYSGRDTPGQLVARDAAAWAALWREHTANQSPAPPAPAVDLGREQVVAVFAGERPSSGHAVEIVSVTQRAGADGRPQITVTVRYQEPPPGSPVLDVMTAPFHIIAIPQIPNAHVTFATR